MPSAVSAFLIASSAWSVLATTSVRRGGLIHQRARMFTVLPARSTTRASGGGSVSTPCTPRSAAMITLRAGQIALDRGEDELERR